MSTQSIGQDCIPDAMEGMKISGTPLLASVSHEVHTYDPRVDATGAGLGEDMFSEV